MRDKKSETLQQESLISIQGHKADYSLTGSDYKQKSLNLPVRILQY